MVHDHVPHIIPPLAANVPDAQIIIGDGYEHEACGVVLVYRDTVSEILGLIPPHF